MTFIKNKGNTYITIIIIFFIISGIFLSLALFARTIISFFSQSKQNYTTKNMLKQEANRLIELLLADSTPEADSKFDPIWEEIKLILDKNIRVDLEDISSKVDLNHISVDLLKSAYFLKAKADLSSFNNFRKNLGLSYNFINDYKYYFDKDILEEYCTEYSFYNINISDDYMLYILFKIRSSNESEANHFYSLIKSKRNDNIIINEQKLREVLSNNYNILYPLINTLPQFNINFINETLLYWLVKSVKEQFKLNLDESFINVLLNQRNYSEIKPEYLSEIIKPNFKNTILEQILGCKTWFWRLSLKKDNIKYIGIICYLPKNKEEAETKFIRIIKEDYFGE